MGLPQVGLKTEREAGVAAAGVAESDAAEVWGTGCLR